MKKILKSIYNIEKSNDGKLDPDIKKKLDSYRKELEEEKKYPNICSFTEYRQIHHLM